MLGEKVIRVWATAVPAESSPAVVLRVLRKPRSQCCYVIETDSEDRRLR
jgi:hypothetical protein